MVNMMKTNACNSPPNTPKSIIGTGHEPRDHERERRDDELFSEDVAEQDAATAKRYG